MFRYLLFDADRTLFDFVTSERKALQKTVESFGFEYKLEFHTIYTKMNQQVWEEFEQNLVTLEQLQVKRFTLFTEYVHLPVDPPDMNVRYVNFLSNAADFIPGAPELLQQLQGKYTLALVTNGISKVQRGRLRNTDMEKYFNAIVVSEEVGVQKPDARYFQYCLQKLGNPPLDQILMIGDSLSSDIQGAKNSGIKSCLLDIDRKYSGQNPVPDFVIHSLDELWRII
ncbi:MAG: YjjG family noncanonical pyrimidine nucleotidase [Spirochaetia bacterium]|nr:YjjG family noncanonical pyrimidine nucleotidase [Spirochaetia bacterium]